MEEENFEKKEVHEEKKVDAETKVPEKKEPEKNPVSEKKEEPKTNVMIDNNPDKKSVFKMTESLKQNPWKTASIVLGIAVIILLILVLRGGITGGVIGVSDAGGNVISAEDAGAKLVDYLNSRTGGGVEYVSSEETGDNLYTITVSYQGSEIPVFITKDGEYFVQAATPMNAEVNQTQTQTQTQEEVPKSNIPEVELFIWGYCPYGVQAQGPMAEVAKLLEDSADFKAVMYYDGHGPFETQENKLEECIQQIDSDKYWDYATGFVEDVYPICSQSRDVECDKEESTKVMDSLGIDSDAVWACVDEQGEDLISAASERAGSLGVTGSPTIVINGVKANVARNADAIKTAVCDAFNDAPEECSESLGSDTTAASGSC